MQTSLNQLKMVQSKFVESQECLSKVTQSNVGKDMLVPLTSSVSLLQSLVTLAALFYVKQLKVISSDDHYKVITSQLLSNQTDSYDAYSPGDLLKLRPRFH